MDRNLHIVATFNKKEENRFDCFKYLCDFFENLQSVFISKNEKIYIIKDILIDIYRDYEITTGSYGEPYFIRAEKKIRRIIRENRVNYYFNLLTKNRKY